MEYDSDLNCYLGGEMKRLVVAVICSTCSIAGYATEPSALVKCSSIDDSVKRLACYDGLAAVEHQEASTAVAKSLAPPDEDVGKWTVLTDKSKIDDSNRVMLILNADEPVPGRFSRQVTPSLIIRCMENVTSVYLEFDGLFMSDNQGYGRVTFRVNKNPAFEKEMSASTNNKALGLWSGGSSIPFIKQLLDGETLVVRATPYNESARTMEFSIKGISNAVAPVRKECKW